MLWGWFLSRFCIWKLYPIKWTVISSTAAASRGSFGRFTADVPTSLIEYSDPHARPEKILSLESSASVANYRKQPLHNQVTVDEGRQFLFEDVELGNMLQDHRREILFLLIEVVEMDFNEGKFEVAVEVPDGLQLSSKSVVEEDEGEGFFDLCFLLHASILSNFIFVW